MSILKDVKDILDGLNIPNETIKWSGKELDTYVVLTPLSYDYEFADNKPIEDIQEVRISLFMKSNFNELTRKIVNALLEKDLTITSRKYIDFEEDTFYYHYAIDVEKNYNMEDK